TLFKGIQTWLVIAHDLLTIGEQPDYRKAANNKADNHSGFRPWNPESFDLGVNSGVAGIILRERGPVKAVKAHQGGIYFARRMECTRTKKHQKHGEHKKCNPNPQETTWSILSPSLGSGRHMSAPKMI